MSRALAIFIFWALGFAIGAAGYLMVPNECSVMARKHIAGNCGQSSCARINLGRHSWLGGEHICCSDLGE
jgi:hypothetical protein